MELLIKNALNGPVLSKSNKHDAQKSETRILDRFKSVICTTALLLLS